MNRSVWSKMGVCAAVSALTTLGCGSVFAEDDEPVDNLSLKIAGAIKPDRFFVRGGVIYIKIKTKSGDTYDVTGPVVTRKDLENIFSTPQQREVIDFHEGFNPPVPANTRATVANAVKGGAGIALLLDTMGQLRVDSLGTPAGIKGIAEKNAATAGISLGYYLDEARNWVAETYVLAAPISTSVTATGRTTLRETEDENGLVVYDKTFGLQGKKIISTKLLPPTLILGRYWGNKDAKFRPYTALMATYAIFYDTKATGDLNSYVGGSKPGDTTVSIKNAFGVGPVLGFKYQFGEKWHASLNVGHVKLKTEATLTTRNTFITSSTGAIQDYGRNPGDPGNGSISDTIATGEVAFGPDGGQPDGVRAVVQANGGLVSLVSKGIAASKGQENLGTFVRKTDTTLTNTLFMLSIGRSF